MREEVFDVVVVGGGPAGATLATHLAEQRIRVGVVERRRLAGNCYDRDKPCGGGLDGRVWNFLPRSVEVDEAKASIVDQWIYGIVARYGGKHDAYHERAEPIIGLGMRRRIDGFFMRKALEAGASYVEGKVIAIERVPGSGYRVQLADGSWLRGRYLVGADGVYSTVGRATGLVPRMQTFVASEYETEVFQPRMWEAWEGKTLIDIAAFPTPGYCWIFTKGNGHLSIGWGLPKRIAGQLKFRTRELFSQNAVHGQIHESGHHIPFNVNGGPVVRDHALLVGDSAGLCNPTNGAGIGPAITSAYWAARAICQDMKSPGSIATYQQYVNALLADYKRGKAMRNYLIFRMMLNPARATKDEEIWGWFIDDLQGRLSYHRWANDHPWAARLGTFLNPIVDRVMVRS